MLNIYLPLFDRMKSFILLLGLLNGGYMLVDGVFVLLNGKFIGPDKPGPWANLFYKLNIDVFKLGPVFILYGLLWLLWVYAIWTNQSWSHIFGVVISFLTLWYLPIGTLISMVLIILLLLMKNKTGF